jgi:hypothetical protein
MLVEFVRRGIRPEAILFADVGDEKRQTYAYLPVMQRFLAAHDFPAIQVVRYVPKRAPYRTLEENCLMNRTLPSLAFGRKACSLKWKRQPQDKWMRRFRPAMAAWARGEKVIKAIGYDAGPKDARRQHLVDDREYRYWYPLQDWGWDRERCKLEIAHAGLPVPVKSACFFCPATKPAELHALDKDYLERIVQIEETAKPNLKKIEGLWRCARKRDNRPGSMTEYIYREGLLELPVLADESCEVAECVGGCYC